MLLIGDHRARRRLPELRQSRRRVRHRRDDGDADRLDPDLRRDAPAVGLAGVDRDPDHDAAAADRPHVPRLERAQDPRGRLVPAADRRRRVHAADDVEARPLAADAAPRRRCDAARPLHPEHRGVAADARRGHGRIPDVDAEPRAACAAAQPEAQQGAARARRVPDRRDARHSVRAGRGARRRSSRSAATSTGSLRTTASRTTRTCPSCSRIAGARASRST